MIACSLVVSQRDFTSRILAWPIRPWHMHRLIIMSHNSVTEIKLKLTCSKIGTGIACQFDITLVLATGLGNPPADRFLPGGSVRFRSLTGPKPQHLFLGGFVTRTEPKPCVVWPGGNGTAGPSCSSYIFGSNEVFEF